MIDSSQKKFPTWGKILIGAVVFIGSTVGLVFWLTQGIVDIAEEHFEALKRGDLQSAYDLTSQSFQEGTSFDDYSNLVGSYPILSNFEHLSFNSREVENNNEGMLEGTLTSTDGQVAPLRLRFVKERNEWKILSVEFSPAGASPTSETAE